MKRLVWRHVPRGAEPLHFGWMQRARGRWNSQRPRFACLYTSLSRDGAMAEYDKAAREPGFGRSPRDLVSLSVIVTPVLNLCDPEIQTAYGITAAHLNGGRPADLAACRRAAKRAVGDGFRALLAPSAALPTTRNLMIYPESHHGRLLLTNGPTRLPVNHGPSPLRS